MRFAIISCAVFTRELSRIVAACRHSCRLYYLDMALHLSPEKMKKEIQKTIDHIEYAEKLPCKTQKTDAILLFYGLCSKGTSNLYAGELPLILPRADDCSAIFLGSQKKYMNLFHECGGGAYWTGTSWVEQGVLPGREYIDQYRAELRKKYEEDIVDYIVETEFGALKKYTDLIFIRETSCREECLAAARRTAEYWQWNFREVEGSVQLMQDLVNGNWDDGRFIVVPPHHKVCPSNDERKFKIIPV